MARRIVLAGILFMLAVGLFIQPVPAKAASQALEVTRDMPFIPGEVVVLFDGQPTAKQTAAQAQALAGEIGAMVVQQAPGIALLSVDPDTDVEALAQQVNGYAGVASAGPNYISWIPESEPVSNPYQVTEVTRVNEAGDSRTLSIDDLAKMTSIRKSQKVPTYSNDGPMNWGYGRMGAPIIWIEAKASPEVCVIDTGADIAHPDLTGNVVNGWDFVNNDAIANDDNGHGTHVAGVIAAKSNNGIGIAGISNGKVVAVKVMTSDGWGTTFNIVQGINFCANRSTVKVINMSLSGGYDVNEYNALVYAIVTKGKLVVAAAGNAGTSTRSYPGGFADDSFIGSGLISVGAAVPETIWIDKNSNGVKDTGETYNDCAASFSNYGIWVSVVAPGKSIYSTLPVSYPFSLNYYDGFYSGYDFLDGTSMASPQVAAAAARVWSLHNSGTNNWTPSQIKQEMLDTGESITTAVTGGPAGDRTTCWPSSMAGAKYVNVASAMRRGAISAEAVDSTTGLPLTGANLYAFKKNTTIVEDVALVSTNNSRYVDLINLPTYTLNATGYPVAPIYHELGVNKAGYTSGTVKYLPYSIALAYGRYGWVPGSMAAVPPNKGFSVVLNWETSTSGNLDLYLWMPYLNPNAVVGPFNIGDLAVAPFARKFHNGGTGNFYVGVETIMVKNTGAVPYYPGYHDILVYDTDTFGQHLNDSNAYVRVWYGGTVKWTNWISNTCSNETSEDWWYPGLFYKNGSTTGYSYADYCGNSAIQPWATSQGISTIDKE